jgi:hypothetical protein
VPWRTGRIVHLVPLAEQGYPRAWCGTWFEYVVVKAMASREDGVVVHAEGSGKANEDGTS